MRTGHCFPMNNQELVSLGRCKEKKNHHSHELVNRLARVWKIQHDDIPRPVRTTIKSQYDFYGHVICND